MVAFRISALAPDPSVPPGSEHSARRASCDQSEPDYFFAGSLILGRRPLLIRRGLVVVQLDATILGRPVAVRRHRPLRSGCRHALRPGAPRAGRIECETEDEPDRERDGRNHQPEVSDQALDPEIARPAPDIPPEPGLSGLLRGQDPAPGDERREEPEQEDLPAKCGATPTSSTRRAAATARSRPRRPRPRRTWPSIRPRRPQTGRSR